MLTRLPNHPATTGAGRIGGYIPQGCAPFAIPDHECNRDGVCVLHNGDPVRVESAWLRPSDGFVFLYVTSVVTNIATHIPAYDYLAIDRIIVGAPGEPAAWDPIRRNRNADVDSEVAA
ncbi:MULTISPECIES: hypothetical protein [unclassified Microbacterium]|uniref:hypothetical protein n=1 Tax=unclassified Microbacterium TaxID=2609290 RepID=UPI002882FC07|nr:MULTISPECIES: hypothetical protein [unclassified Microbacterium]